MYTRAKSLWSCPTLCDPLGYSPSGSSVRGILQARILEWVAMPSSGDLPAPGIEPASPAVPALQVDPSSPRHQGSPKEDGGWGKGEGKSEEEGLQQILFSSTPSQIYKHLMGRKWHHQIKLFSRHCVEMCQEIESEDNIYTALLWLMMGYVPINISWVENITNWNAFSISNWWNMVP